MDPSQKKVMPDIAESQKSSVLSPLKWVGMEKVDLPIRLNKGIQVAAEADIFVNVAREDAKGIHMSRLYLSILEGLSKKDISVSTIKGLLNNFIDSQKGLSNAAKLVLRWKELHNRKALLSDYEGFKTYPVEIDAEMVAGELTLNFNVSVFYSSTCPCSSALARQLYQQAFAKEFCEDNLSFDKVFNWLGESQIATPHSQRSRADISLKVKDAHDDLTALKYIDAIEEALKTPVQTAVKREDEQEFARLNGENALFVEDALRVMKKSLQNFSELESFEIKTHHFESLHAHDAVGVIRS